MDLSVIQGVVVIALNSTSSVDFYVLDMRMADEEPLNRLKLHLQITLDHGELNDSIVILHYLDPINMRMHVLLCTPTKSIHVIGEMDGSKAILSVLPAAINSKLTVNDLVYKGAARGCEQAIQVPIKLYGIEWDGDLIAIPAMNQQSLYDLTPESS